MSVPAVIVSIGASVDASSVCAQLTSVECMRQRIRNDTATMRDRIDTQQALDTLDKLIPRRFDVTCGGAECTHVQTLLLGHSNSFEPPTRSHIS